MPYVNMSNMSAGMVRYNGNNQNFEVYDGNNWMTMPSNYVNIDFDPDTRSLIDWVRKKRNEEMERDHLAQRNPAIKDLLSQREAIDDKIRMINILTKDEIKV